MSEPLERAPGMPSNVHQGPIHSRNTRAQAHHEKQAGNRSRSRNGGGREHEGEDETAQSSSESESAAPHVLEWTPPDVRAMSKEDLFRYHQRNQDLIANLKLQGLSYYVDRRVGSFLSHHYYSLSVPNRSSPFFEINKVYMRYYKDPKDHHVVQEVINPDDHDEIYHCQVSPTPQPWYWKASEESTGFSLSHRRARMYGFVTREEEGGGGEGRRW